VEKIEHNYEQKALALFHGFDADQDGVLSEMELLALKHAGGPGLDLNLFFAPVDRASFLRAWANLAPEAIQSIFHHIDHYHDRKIGQIFECYDHDLKDEWDQEKCDRFLDDVGPDFEFQFQPPVDWNQFVDAWAMQGQANAFRVVQILATRLLELQQGSEEDSHEDFIDNPVFRQMEWNDRSSISDGSVTSSDHADDMHMCFNFFCEVSADELQRDEMKKLLSTLGYSNISVQKLLDRFEFPLAFDEFRDVVPPVLGSYGMTKVLGFIDKRIEYIFGHFDRRSRGFLNIRECKEVLRASGQANPSDDLVLEIFNPPVYTTQFVDFWRGMFESLDLLKKLEAHIVEHVRYVFNYFDYNGTGRLSSEQCKKLGVLLLFSNERDDLNEDDIEEMFQPPISFERFVDIWRSLSTEITNPMFINVQNFIENQVEGVQRIFDFFDKQENNYLSIQDCLLMFQAAGRQMTEEQLKKIITPPVNFQDFLKLWKAMSHEETKFLMQNIHHYIKQHRVKRKRDHDSDDNDFFFSFDRQGHKRRGSDFGGIMNAMYSANNDFDFNKMKQKNESGDQRKRRQSVQNDAFTSTPPGSDEEDGSISPLMSPRTANSLQVQAPTSAERRSRRRGSVEADFDYDQYEGESDFGSLDEEMVEGKLGEYANNVILREAFMQYSRVMRRPSISHQRGPPVKQGGIGHEKFRRRSISLESKFKLRPSPRDIMERGKDLKRAGEQLQQLMNSVVDTRPVQRPPDTFSASVYELLQNLSDYGMSAENQSKMQQQILLFKSKHDHSLTTLEKAYEERIQESFKLSEDLKSQIIRDERKFKQELDEQTSVNLYLENQLKQTQTDLKDLEAKNTLRIEELTIEYERKIERQRKRAQAQDREDKRLRDTFMKSLYKDQQKYDAVVDRRRNLQNQLESKLLGITEYEQVIVENDESADSSIHKESSGDNNDLVQHYKKEMDILQEKHELELKRQRDSIKFLTDSIKSAERFNDEADKNLKEMEDRHKQRERELLETSDSLRNQLKELTRAATEEKLVLQKEHNAELRKERENSKLLASSLDKSVNELRKEIDRKQMEYDKQLSELKFSQGSGVKLEASSRQEEVLTENTEWKQRYNQAEKEKADLEKKKAFLEQRVIAASEDCIILLRKLSRIKGIPIGV